MEDIEYYKRSGEMDWAYFKWERILNWVLQYAQNFAVGTKQGKNNGGGEENIGVVGLGLKLSQECN